MDGSTPHTEGRPTERDATRCVVLAPADVALNEGMRLRLRERGWRTMTVHDPHIAMAELCLQERLQASRSAWGLQRAERLALVIAPHGSDAAENVSMLLTAVRRYVPAANVWRYEDEQLRLIIAGTHPEPSEKVDEPADPVLASASTSAADESAGSDASGPQQSDEDQSSHVTADELAMLLARDQDEAPPS